jgi:hypothetical protein
MKRNDEMRVRASLIKTIERWWDDPDGIQETGVELPTLGDSTLTLMAEAALGVLLAAADVEQYFRENGMLKAEEE